VNYAKTATVEKERQKALRATVKASLRVVEDPVEESVVLDVSGVSRRTWWSPLRTMYQRFISFLTSIRFK
jgi:hypothetical protein